MADELWKRKFDSEHRTRYKEYRTRIRSPRIGKEKQEEPWKKPRVMKFYVNNNIH